MYPNNFTDSSDKLKTKDLSNITYKTAPRHLADVAYNKEIYNDSEQNVVILSSRFSGRRIILNVWVLKKNELFS